MSARLNIVHYLYLNYFFYNVCWATFVVAKVGGDLEQ